MPLRSRTEGPWFGLELWFLTSFQGKPVWSLNREHLAYLIDYLSADQRKSRWASHERPRLTIYHLHENRKNRERIVKLLKKMQEE